MGSGRAHKCLDRHIPVWEYTSHGICVRHPRGAEPPRPVESSGHIGEVGRGARTPAPDAPALGVETPPGAAGGRLRGVAGRGPAPRLPAPARTPHGSGFLARPVPPVLVGPRRCARTPPGSHGTAARTETQETKSNLEGEEAMSNRESYIPGAAADAEVRKDGDNWTLVLVRELRHSPEKVWQALTDPAQLREWAPYDADRSLGTVGSTVKLTTVGAPTPHVSETTVTRADAPKVLQYNWGGFDIRWKLEALGGGTRLTLWTNIDRRFISMGAAGWHICLDVLDHLLSGTPIGRIVGPDAMKFGGWQRLNAEYAKQFGLDTPNWPPNAPKR